MLTAQIQQAWRLRLESYFHAQSVYKNALTNNHYEGDVKGNGTLNIVSIGDVVEQAYTGAWNDTTGWPDLATTGQTFSVDQQRFFTFRVKKTDTLTTAINLMDGGSKQATFAVLNRQDQYIASLYTQVTSNLYGDDTTPITVGFDSAAGEVLPTVALTEMTRIMAEANADQSSVNVVIPPWLSGYLLQELGTHQTGVGDSATGQGVAQGKMNGVSVAGLAGVHVSNNCPNTGGSKYKVLGGTPNSAITFASQLEEFSMLELQNDFAMGAKGLYVYGGKVPFEQHMVLATLNKGTARARY